VDLKKCWEEDEAETNRKGLAKEREIFCVEDVMWEISLTRDKCCNNCRGLLDPCLTLLRKFADQKRQELDQEFQEQIES
jgi:hypothetical protein